MHEIAPTNPENSTTGMSIYSLFLVLVCAGLAIEVVLLVRTNRNLRQQLADMKSVMQDSTPDIRPGETFELPTLVREDGVEFTVPFGEDQPRTLVLVYSSSCRACVETIPVWNDIMIPTAGASVRIVPILVGNDENISTSNSAIAAPVYSLPSDGARFARRVVKVPATILLDGFGVVEQSWMGFLTEEKAISVQNAIAGKG